MNKQFVTKEIAFALKELEFDEECFGFYHNAGSLHLIRGNWNRKLGPKEHIYCSAPLWQQAIDFLREKHNIHIIITCIRCHIIPTDIIGFQYGLEGNIFYDKDDTYATYPEAREQAILKAIELCRNKN